MRGGILSIKNIKQLESYDIDPNHLLNSKFIFNNSQYIDYEWIQKQMDYINNLSDRQKHILRSYTIYGDKFINNYLRGTLSQSLIDNILDDCIKYNENPFIYQHQDKTGISEINEYYKKYLLNYIKTFIEELSHIIMQSPKLTKKIKVFRGLSDGDFLVQSLKQNTNGKQYVINNDFISTSFYLASAKNFMNNDCCLLDLTLEVNTPCIFTAHISRRRNEFEITILPGTKMLLSKCTRKFILSEYEHYDNLDVFINPKNHNLEIVRMCEFNVYPV
jgi:hypothetical protein